MNYRFGTLSELLLRNTLWTIASEHSPNYRLGTHTIASEHSRTIASEHSPNYPLGTLYELSLRNTLWTIAPEHCPNYLFRNTVRTIASEYCLNYRFGTLSELSLRNTLRIIASEHTPSYRLVTLSNYRFGTHSELSLRNTLELSPSETLSELSPHNTLRTIASEHSSVSLSSICMSKQDGLPSPPLSYHVSVATTRYTIWKRNTYTRYMATYRVAMSVVSIHASGVGLWRVGRSIERILQTGDSDRTIKHNQRVLQSPVIRLIIIIMLITLKVAQMYNRILRELLTIAWNSSSRQRMR